MILKETNLNDYIKVKLYKKGVQYLVNRHNEMYKDFDSIESIDESNYIDRMDEEGYMKFQIHDFINLFGEVMTIGIENYMNLNVEIQVKP